MSEQPDLDPHTKPTSEAVLAANPVRVLVVDPDADTRALYREAFHSHGWDVVEGADGREGLAKALATPPALVVTEIGLPFLDGYALCDILRRDRATAAVPILVVTAQPRAAGADALRAGADAVLSKPATAEQVLAETRRLLSDRRDGDESVSPAALRTVGSSPRLSKSFARFMTTTPPASPPQLLCPACDQSLTYQHSHVGGVSAKNAEQWDLYACSGSCGTFQYRHRTRKLRRVA